MPSLMRAIAKALSQLAGPAGFPIEFVISLYDDEQTKKRFDAIMNKLSAGNSPTKDEVEEIFRDKQTTELLHNYLAKSFNGVFKILIENQDQLRSLLLAQSSNTPTDRMTEVILPLLSNNENRLVKEGLMTEQLLIKELTYLYTDVDLFLTVVYFAGFPQGIIAVNTPPRVAYFHFIMTFRGLTREQKKTISAALSEDKPGSEILKTWSSFFV